MSTISYHYNIDVDLKDAINTDTHSKYNSIFYF